MDHYVNEADYEDALETLVKLSEKKLQSSFVIFGLITYSVKILFPKIEHKIKYTDLYLENLRTILNIIPITHDKKSRLFKQNIFKAINSKHFDEVQHIILNHELSEDGKFFEPKSFRKSISIGDVGLDTDNSTSFDNKLEISVREISPTARNLNIIPNLVTKKSEKLSSTTCLKGRLSDNIPFTKITPKRNMPFLYIAIDITTSAEEIKKIFIDEMRRYKFY